MNPAAAIASATPSWAKSGSTPGGSVSSGTVPGKPLALENHDAQALPDAPERGGRTRRSASHDHDVDLRTRNLAHGLVRREVMLPGAILSQKDIRQVGVGDSCSSIPTRMRRTSSEGVSTPFH